MIEAIDQDVADEVLFDIDRVELEEDFHAFAKAAWPIVEPETQFVDNWHIKAVCDHLAEVSHGKRIKKLLINVPPGTMKSLLVSVFWLAWVWTTKPWTRWFFASYGGSLVIRDSSKTQVLLDSDWYQSRWPMRFGKKTEALLRNTDGGWRQCSIVGGEATGHHPDFKVVDDPHNAKAVDSEADRRNAVVWWDGTMSSRGAIRGAKSVIVMQRLHSKDLSGHVMDKGGWTHLCLPMRYEAPSTLEHDGIVEIKPRMVATPIGFQDPRTVDGQLLWPQIYDEAKVAELEAELGPYNAAGQLQQRPAPREGGQFKRAWFAKIMRALPVGEVVDMVRYWDKAGSTDPGACRTAGVLVALLRSGAVVICHEVSGRWSAVERENVILQTARADKARFGRVRIWVEQEPGSGGLESAEATIRRLRGFSCKADKVSGSKEVRAEPLATFAEAGNVWMLWGDWNSAFLDELEAFPSGKYRDRVDAAGGAFNKLHGSKVKALDPNNLPNTKPPTVVTRAEGIGAVAAEVDTNDRITDEDL